MSKTRITIEDAKGTTVVLTESSPLEAIGLLSQDLNALSEIQELGKIVNDYDASIVVEVQSSMAERIEFNASSGTLTFVTHDGTNILLQADLDTFKEALAAPSIGRFYHQLRRRQIGLTNPMNGV